jgi:hypothetical protein
VVVSERQALHQVIDEMTDDELEELRVLALYQQHKKTHPGSAWMKTLYDLFAPVRAAAAEANMTEEEIDQILDEALDEVRREPNA